MPSLSLQKILKKTKKILSKLDNERLAIAAVSLVGLSLLFFLIIAAPELLESAWFLNILTVLAEYGSFIAGGAYIGRLFNLFTARLVTENKKEKTNVTTLLNNEVVMGRLIKNQEKELTPVGMLLGMVLAIICIVLHVTVPFLSVFSYFAYVLFILGYACTLGGLFNRLGSVMDDSRLPQEKKIILFGAIFGLLFALSLIAILAVTGTLPLVAVAGITKIFFDLFLLHKTLFTITFILSLTSLSTSFFDYFSKATCFLKYRFHLGAENEKLNACLKSRYHEYRGAFLGFVTGSLLAIGIITGLVLTGGVIAAPIAVGTTLFLTTIICGSVISSLFSRIGRVIDGVNRASAPSVPSDPTVPVEYKCTNKSPVTLTSSINGYLNTKGVTRQSSANFTEVLIMSKEHKVQIHSYANTLENGVCNPVIDSSGWQPQEQTYSSYLIEVHLGKRSAKLFGQNSTAFFQLDKDAENKNTVLPYFYNY